jgi:WD40 repeat protein
MLASGSNDCTVKLWNTNTGDCEWTLDVDSGELCDNVKSVSFSPMGDMIAAGCGYGKIHLIDAMTVAVKRSLSGNCPYSK